MTIKMFDNAINGIRPELIEEAANISPAPVKKPFYRYAAVAAVFALCVVGGALAASHITRTPTGTTSEISNIGGNELYGGNVNDSLYGNEFSVTTPNSKPEIKGTPFTDNEIIAFIEENKEHITCTISAEYQIIGEEIQLFTKGYYHVVLSETNCVDLDFLTLPICVDNKIIANLELSRYNGEIIYTINAGGDKWATMNEALEYSDNIAFVFGGFANEVAIAPDNTVFEITPYANNFVTAGYDLLATEYNLFSQSMLMDEKNYITVVAE